MGNEQATRPSGGGAGRQIETVSDPDFGPPDAHEPAPGLPGITVGSIMAAAVAVIGPDVTTRAAADHMRRSETAVLLVSDVAQFSGVLTDRNVADWLSGGGVDTVPVRDVMTPGVDVCFADQDVSEAAGLMRERAVAWLVVLDRTGQPAGVVSFADLVGSGGNYAQSGVSVAGGFGPAYPPRR